MMKLATLLFMALPLTATQDPAKWEEAIQKYEAADKASPPKLGGVVFVGSSSIVGWRSLAKDFPSLNTINRGFGGSQLSDSVHFAERIVTKYEPKMVVLFAGTNDLASGKTPEAVLANFEMFVKKVHAKVPAARIGFISISPTPSRWANNENVKKANAMIRNFILTRENLVYIDVYTPMLSPDGGPRPELFVSDQLHLNADGYALWKKVVGPYLPW